MAIEIAVLRAMLITWARYLTRTGTEKIVTADPSASSRRTTIRAVLPAAVASRNVGAIATFTRARPESRMLIRLGLWLKPMSLHDSNLSIAPVSHSMSKLIFWDPEPPGRMFNSWTTFRGSNRGRLRKRKKSYAKPVVSVVAVWICLIRPSCRKTPVFR